MMMGFTWLACQDTHLASERLATVGVVTLEQARLAIHDQPDVAHDPGDSERARGFGLTCVRGR